MSSLSDGTGQYVYNSHAQYKPFGAYQTEPVTNPSLTDRGYTGHRHNNTGTYDLGLIYMNARYYLPEIGRFISPDTLVPDPTNSQSYNRYSYVRNSPINFKDPSGHRECGIDCNNPLPNQPPPSISEQIAQGSNVYGITFVNDGDMTWGDAEKLVALGAAADVDRRLRSTGFFAGAGPGYAFRRAFGGIRLVRSAETHYTDAEGMEHEIKYGAETFGSKIEFYPPAFGVNPFDPKFRYNSVHELGHAFNAVLVGASDGSVNPYNDLNVALSEGGELSTFGRRAGMSPYPFQQHADSSSTNEVFADYYLNWTYDSFLNNAAGLAQYNWINHQIRPWLAQR